MNRQSGDLENLVQTLELLPLDAPEKPAALLEQALAYRAMGLAVRFENCLVQCLLLTANRTPMPDEAIHAQAHLADHYLLQERNSEAMDALWRLVESARDREQVMGLMLRATAADDNRYDPTESIAWHMQFLVRDPDDCETHRVVGINLARLARWDEARTHLEPCFEKNRETTRFVVAWLWFLATTEDFVGVKKALDTLPDAFRGQADYWLYAGMAAEARNDWLVAVSAYGRAIECAPNRLDVNSRFAQALRAAGRSADAEQQVARSKKLAEAKRELVVLRQRLMQTQAIPSSDDVQRISRLCESLGWEREAAAWKIVK